MNRLSIEDFEIDRGGGGGGGGIAINMDKTTSIDIYRYIQIYIYQMEGKGHSCEKVLECLHAGTTCSHVQEVRCQTKIILQVGSSTIFILGPLVRRQIHDKQNTKLSKMFYRTQWNYNGTTTRCIDNVLLRYGLFIKVIVCM